jgi:hypothetical protein
MNDGSLAGRASSIYSLLVIQLFSSHFPLPLDAPEPATAAGRVANEYLNLLKVYLDPSETRVQSAQSGGEGSLAC